LGMAGRHAKELVGANQCRFESCSGHYNLNSYHSFLKIKTYTFVLQPIDLINYFPLSTSQWFCSKCQYFLIRG
jgi:hypothetical protein